MATNLVLSCTVPTNAIPGKTFHVKLESENRYFEVVVPDGVQSGDIINVIVPSKSIFSSNSVQDKTINNNTSSNKLSLWNVINEIFQYTCKRAEYLNSHYKLMDKLLVIADPGKMF
jgi:hypothetical protein